MCASSLERAKYTAEEVGDSVQYGNDCNKGILVGGMTASHVHLRRHEIQLIQDCCGPDVGDIPEHGDAFKSLFKPLHTSCGMLYRTGENIILDDSQPAYVAQVERFLCLSIDGTYQKFVQTQQYPMMLDDDGEQLIDHHSGYNVVTTSTATLKIFKITSISRKVMLHPFSLADDPEAAIVIDHGRKTLPSEVWDLIIPFYPELDDMILIRGEDPEPWLAKVVGIQERAKTVRVLYYEKDCSRPGQDLYVAMTSRLAYDYVPWNSVISVALGAWNGSAWELY